MGATRRVKHGLIRVLRQRTWSFKVEQLPCRGVKARWRNAPRKRLRVICRQTVIDRCSGHRHFRVHKIKAPASWHSLTIPNGYAFASAG